MSPSFTRSERLTMLGAAERRAKVVVGLDVRMSLRQQVGELAVHLHLHGVEGEEDGDHCRHRQRGPSMLRLNRAMPWVMRSAAGSLLTLTAIEVPALNVRDRLTASRPATLPGPFRLAFGLTQLLAAALPAAMSRPLSNAFPGRAAVMRDQRLAIAAGHDAERPVGRERYASKPRIDPA